MSVQISQNVHQLILTHGRDQAREMVPERQRTLVDIAAQVLGRVGPGRVAFDVYGDGPARARLLREVAARRLGDVVRVRGRVARAALAVRDERCAKGPRARVRRHGREICGGVEYAAGQDESVQLLAVGIGLGTPV